MNKRIKELDQQAVDYANNVCDANGIYKGKEYLTVVKEKFAELIVQECQFRVEQYINECGEIASMPDTVIMKHFGVEV